LSTCIHSLAEQQPFIDLVDTLLLAKQNTQSLSQNSLSQYETQIDELVYALYGITDEERAVIEG
jgi:hypothetical protein